MTACKFPTQIQLALSDLERLMFDYLAERLSNKSEKELVQGVLSKGLVLFVDEERTREGRMVQSRKEGAREGSPMMMSASLAPFPKPHCSPSNSVPQTVDIHLDEDLREDLDQFLARYGTDLQSAVTTLLRVGLKTAEEEPAVFEDLNTESIFPKTTRSRRRRQIAELYATVAAR